MKKNLKCFLVLLCAVHAHAAEEVTTPDIEIRSRFLRATDEVTYSPQVTRVENPARDQHLGATLTKLPSLVVRNSSGLGGLTTVVGPGALGAGGTLVTIEGIPIPSPSGRGINLGLFPGPLLSGVEYLSAFSVLEDSSHTPRFYDGGRLNLRLFPLAGTSREHSVTAMGDSVGSAELAAGSKDEKLAVGAMGYNTPGDFPFKNQPTGERGKRDHNSAHGGSGLAGVQVGKLKLLGLASGSERLNPAFLGATEPGAFHTREHDYFHFFGLDFDAPELISPKDGVIARASTTLARTTTQNLKAPVFGAASSDQKEIGAFTQLAYRRRENASRSGGKPWVSYLLSVDDEYDNLREDGGRHKRHVYGLSTSIELGIGQWRLVPMARQESGTRLSSETDVSGLLGYDFGEKKNSVEASYGSFHSYPTFTQLYGYKSGTFVILPNPELKTQRNKRAQLAYSHHEQIGRLSTALQASAFYDKNENRAVYDFGSAATGFQALFVNASEVRSVGGVLDGQVGYDLGAEQRVQLRGAWNQSRTYDRKTGQDLPFKPRTAVYGEITFFPKRWIGISWSESYLGRRFFDYNSDRVLAQTHFSSVRMDFEISSGWNAFAKVSNLFDRAGEDYPGSPLAGRVWVFGVNAKNL